MYNGHDELWDLVDTVLGQKDEGKPGEARRILHINDLAKAYYGKIQKLETASPFTFLGTALSKKEDRAAECARLLLKLGNFKGYCEIMCSLSTRAL